MSTVGPTAAPTNSCPGAGPKPAINRQRCRVGSLDSAYIQIAVPIFGYKSHIGIDRRHGLIRRWTVTDAAQHDSRSFPILLDPENTASRVWADTAYRTKRNLEVLERRGLTERIQFRRPPRRQLSERQAKANASRARIRSGIEHVFAAQ
ncbi:hypothetical protein EBE87_26095 [Pseudoroseomonas wenyumeiae]|uniref:Transposase IS4-like domain-containing protein n=1 Tax=Teichococcus wenyumeiae TaxID=2478470 RepID=A0A3A9IX95_9PROT|nr:hypothetical protein D6Z83_28115 [Pseudoroseomonas wenyumeiae]RMI15349.1 hypothetical protein EBE87_26095 [Pseudoroseomonas wenyumeiae]